MNPAHQKWSLDPIIQPSSKILILGSLPGDLSLEESRYYANPRNHFWKIMFTLFEEAETVDYEKRVNLILSNGLALWDVLKVCERKGSLDSNIRNAELNDLAGLLEKYPQIHTIIFNGGEANRRLNQNYRKTLSPKLKFECFPSTSPVPGKNVLGYEDKLKVWSQLKKWL